MSNIKYNFHELLFTDLIPNAIIEIKTAIKESKELLKRGEGQKDK
jgi:hypothetical protein